MLFATSEPVQKKCFHLPLGLGLSLGLGLALTLLKKAQSTSEERKRFCAKIL